MAPPAPASLLQIKITHKNQTPMLMAAPHRSSSFFGLKKGPPEA